MEAHPESTKVLLKPKICSARAGNLCLYSIKSTCTDIEQQLSHPAKFRLLFHHTYHQLLLWHQHIPTSRTVGRRSKDLFLWRNKWYVLHRICTLRIACRNIFLASVVQVTENLSARYSRAPKVYGHIYKRVMNYTLRGRCLLVASNSTNIVQC